LKIIRDRFLLEQFEEYNLLSLPEVDRERRAPQRKFISKPRVGLN